MIGLSVATRGYSGVDGNTLSMATWGYVVQQLGVVIEKSLAVDILGPVVLNSSLNVSHNKETAPRFTIPFDVLNNNFIVFGDNDAPLAWMAEVSWSPDIMIESLAPLEMSGPSPVEFLQSAGGSIDAPLVSDKAMETANQHPMDWSGWLRADKYLPADIISRTLCSQQLAVEILHDMAASNAFLCDFIKTISCSRYIPIAIAGGWGEMVFIHPAGAVHFYRRPVRPGAAQRQMYQQQDWDSDGARYTYDKSPTVRAGEEIEFQNLDGLTLNCLLWFFEQTVRGMKNRFTWHDWNGVQHTVRFASPKLDWQQTGPDQYIVKFALIEDLPI